LVGEAPCHAGFNGCGGPDHPAPARRCWL
jgi:hypothetical protein